MYMKHSISIHIRKEDNLSTYPVKIQETPELFRAEAFPGSKHSPETTFHMRLLSLGLQFLPFFIPLLHQLSFGNLILTIRLGQTSKKQPS